MYAPAKPDYPVLAPGDLAQFDAFLFGIPTRYGNFPAQWKVRPLRTALHPLFYPLTVYVLQTFIDGTGQLWASGALDGKSAGLFISTAGAGGGQESTAIAAMSTLVHHGVKYVPLGYKHAFGQLTNLSEVHGGEYPIIHYQTPAPYMYIYQHASYVARLVHIMLLTLHQFALRFRFSLGLRHVRGR